MKKTGIILILSGLILFFFLQTPSQEKKITVGIIVPMEHAALDSIVKGITKEFENTAIVCTVVNAQGDLTIQKALIEKLLRERCDLFMPIGTATSQMTTHLVKNKPVVCVAADPEALSLQSSPKTVVIDDSLPPDIAFEFLRDTLPHAKKITLIYSTSEKIAREIPAIEKAALFSGFTLQKLTVQTISDLYSLSSAIDTDTSCLFVLKDHIVVSGIGILSKQAEKKGIFLMTSDEGSVTSGGAFAIGISESSIGRQGAVPAKKMLAGELPNLIETVQSPMSLFINPAACKRQGIDKTILSEVAKNRDLAITVVGENYAP